MYIDLDVLLHYTLYCGELQESVMAVDWKRRQVRRTEGIISSSEAQKEFIHKRLQDYNAQFMKEFSDFSYHIEVDGSIAAGIVAESVGDTVEVEFLFVEEAHRGCGLGRKLLEHVETAAREQGIRRILLNTYSFQAPDFYRRMGYQEVLQLKPAFDQFSQSYFVKEL